MARISTNRHFKLIMGIVMTFVLVVSLFAGIGAIWVREETHVASADTGMIDGDGKFVMPAGSAGSISDSTKGTAENPFTVLEIVPNANMAQFGYLVKGQEPIDLIEFALNSTDYAANYSKLSEYLEMTRLDEDKAFNIFNEYLRDGEVYDYIKSDGTPGTIAYGDSQIIWDRNAGKTTQYGDYVKDDNGDFAIVQTKVYEPSGYTIIPMTDNSDAPASINEADLEEGAIYKATQADAVAELKKLYPSTTEFSEIQSGSVYRYVDEGTGEFSSAKYVEADDEPFTEHGGTYSLTHKKVATGTGDWEVKETAPSNYYVTDNYIKQAPSGYYYAENDGHDGFLDKGNFVAFRLKTDSDVNVPTYDVDHYHNDFWYWTGSKREHRYNRYYILTETTDSEYDVTGSYHNAETVNVFDPNGVKTLISAGKLPFTNTGSSNYNSNVPATIENVNGKTYVRNNYESSSATDFNNAPNKVAGPNGNYKLGNYRYAYDDTYVYVYHDSDWDRWYRKYSYSYQETIPAGYRHYYFSYTSSPRKEDTNYYMVFFKYNESGNGRYVVDESVKKTSYGYDDYGMTYEKLEGEPAFLGWNEAGAGNGDYIEIVSTADSLPQEVGTYTKKYGDKKTVGLGEYNRVELTAITYVENGTEGGKKVIASKDCTRYAIVPVYSDTDTYKYRLRDYASTEFGTDVTLIARYTWVGDKVVRKSTELTADFIAAHQLPEHLKNDAAARALMYEDEETIPDTIPAVYPEERSFSKGFIGTFKSKDLFKKYAVGLAYKNNDFTKAKDIELFTFAGWYTDPAGVNQFVDSTKITADTTIYAKWLIKYPDDTESGWDGYTVTFDANVGAEDPDKDTVANMPGDTEHHQITGFNRGVKITEPERIPIRRDYLFDGWYTAADNSGTKFDFANTALTDSIMGTTTNDAGETVCDNNLTLYAHWTKIEGLPTTYAFEFNPNTALLPSTAKVRLGDVEYLNISVDKVAVNGRRYYTKTVDGVDTTVTFEEVALEDYEPTAVKKNNGADAGYIFDGWYIDRECRERFTFDAAGMKRIMEAQAAAEGEPETTTFVLFANWVKAASLPTYNVSFNLNKPSDAVANATLTRSDLVSASSNVYRLMGVTYNNTIPEFSDLIPSLEGNLQAKLDSYVVNVVTVTPNDLADSSKKAFELIGRADLIVINETCETQISSLWDKYKKYSSLTSVSGVTSFSQNDISWNATVEILSRITGFKYNATTKTNVTVETCPVLFDYNIYYSCINSTSTSVAKNVTFKVKDKNDTTITVSNEPSSSANIYKLYLMTQTASPVTIYNAYFAGKVSNKIISNSSGKGVIRNSSSNSPFTDGSTDGADNFWNRYTLIPFSVISASEWTDAKRINTLKLLGFNDSITMDTIVGTSSIKNRLFIYNNREAGTLNDINLISGFTNTVKMDTDSAKDVSDMIGAPKSAEGLYQTSEIFYYMLHGTTMYTNLNRDLRILEIQPGTGAHSNEYWFWYISHYAPNVTGTITGNAMSSLEFQCNIEDLNSVYDVIFMGTDKTRYTLSGSVDNSSLSKIEPKTKYEADVYEYEGNISGGLLDLIISNIGSNYYKNLDDIFEDHPVINGVTYDFDGYYTSSSFDGNDILIKDDTLNAYSYRYDENFVYIRQCIAEGYNYKYHGTWYYIEPKYSYYRVRYYCYKTVLREGDTYYTYYHTGNTGKTSQYAIGSFSTLDPVTLEPVVYSSLKKSDSYYAATDVNDDLTVTAAFSGNDFTFTKYKAVAEFLKAGYPIIFDDGFFNLDGSINTGVIDTASWIYKLLKELKDESPNREKYNWFRINTTADADTNAFLKALMNKTFTLNVISKPIEYKDRTLFPESMDEADVDKLIYINGESSSNRELTFEIKIDELVSGGKYRLKLFIDTNADGRYSTETERIDTVSVYDTVARRSYNADTTSLVSGRVYKVSRTLPSDQAGVLAWKLQLTELKSGAETTVRDEVTGLSAIKVSTRTKINVLQIISTPNGEEFSFGYKTKGYTGTDNNATMKGVRGVTTIYLPTDEEIYNGSGLVGANKPKSSTYSYTFLDTNWSKFRKYTKDLDEFEVHFFRVNEAQLAEIAANESKEIGKSYKVVPDGDSYKLENDTTSVTWADINMLVIGFGFGYSDITNQSCRNLIQDFIESGKTVLFTNDTIKDEMMSTKNTFDYVYNHEYHNQASGSRLSSSYSGYNLTRTFRNQIGQDRFGAFVNFGFFDDDAIANIQSSLTSNDKVKSLTKQVNDDLGTAFSSIKIANAVNFSLNYDIPFIAGTTMSLSSISNLQTTKKIEIQGAKYGSSQLEFAGKEINDTRVLVQGLSKNALKEGAFTPVYEATKTNDGQIVSYPYSIGHVAANGTDYVIDTALTRAQYMQLNMEDDDIVVWFSLYKKGVNNGDVSGSIINDGTNNYYIYSKGNITYTGVGFNWGTLEEDEYKLFVNTMIAAYRSGVNATKPIITNPDKSSEDDKDYLYIDYDATVSEEAKAAPIGDDEDITTLKDADGNEILINPETGAIAAASEGGKPVYCKRVRFTLRNDSIVLNKLMTVHYYPCVMVGDVRVTLYDYPMDLATFRVSTEDGEADKNIKDIQTSTAFKYNVPDGVTQNEAIMNEAVKYVKVTPASGDKPKEKGWYVKNAEGKYVASNDNSVKTGTTYYERRLGVSVSGGRGLVTSLSEYYVDVPISESYYKNLIWKKNSVDVASNINYKYFMHGDGTEKYVVIAPTTFGLDEKNSFEMEIQVVMRYGRNPDMNAPLVGTRGVVFMRRGMFTLD